MKAIPEVLKEELARAFTKEQIRHLRHQRLNTKECPPLETLIEKIFRLPGRYIDPRTERIIYLDCQNTNRNIA